MPQRRLTGLYMRPSKAGERSLRSLRGSVRLGRLRLPRLTPPTFCQPWPPLRGALIRADKPLHTAGTLGEVPAPIYMHLFYFQYQL
jgi:hypothetical protein